MNGREYMVQRNRLLMKFEQDLASLSALPEPERQARSRELEQEFDRQLARLYAEVAAEYPGERRKKARPIGDPR